MAKTESSYVPPRTSLPSDSDPEGSATRSFETDDAGPGVGPFAKGSTGKAAAVPSPPLPPDQQQTVISKQSPGSGSSVGPLPTHYELGKTLEGQRLGHFELAEFVGGGGMGAVFRAHDTQLGRMVAVKVLSRDHAADPETVLRFKNEAQSAARLDHDNIARVFYVGEDSGWNYIVFEFIEGINIRDMVQQTGPLPLSQAVSFTLQVAEALSHAARRDVVHRDIKPSNVLITAEGKAKLVDMGLARLHQMESSQADLTASGVTLGTFDYISPEQARDPRGADVRSDLYSLGCTLYYMLSGRPPFPEGTVLQKLLSHSSEEPTDAREFRPDLPDEISQVLSKMLRKHPDDRYQQPSELIGELLLMSDRLGLPVADRGATVWVAPSQFNIRPWERHLPWFVPVAVLVLVVLGLHFFYPASNPISFSPPEDRWTPLEGPTDPDLMPGPTSAATDEAPATTSSPDGDAAEPSAPGDTDTPPADTDTDVESPLEPAPDAGGAPGDGSGEATTTPDEPAPAAEPDARGPDLPADGSDTTSQPGGPDNSETEPDPADPQDPTDAAGENVAPSSDPLLLIVGPDAEPSLESALSKSSENGGETIELHFNGAMTVRPITLEKRRLTIRAGQGYSPTLMITPDFDDILAQRSSMVAISGGELELDGIHLDFSVPLEPMVDRWALFSLQDVKLLSLVRCTLTIRNEDGGRMSRHPDVAFFNLVANATAGGDTVDTPDLLAIDLRHCVVRGEAVLARTTAPVPLRLSWTDGLLLTTERLLHQTGAKQRPAGGSFAKIDLDHVTAVVDGGLVHLETSLDAPFQRMVNVTSNYSIMVTRPDSPLVLQTGPGTVETLQGQFLFSGRGNFYHAVEQFRVVRSTSEQQTPLRDDFAAWNKAWEDEKLPQRDVRWAQFPSDARPVSKLSAADFALSEHPSNPAYRSAVDRTNAGCDFEMLPDHPDPVNFVDPPAFLSPP